MAAFLDTFFYSFDYAILEAIHRFAVATGGVLTPLFHLITSLGDGGIGFILLGLLLLLFRKTRKVGLAVLLAIAIGALFTNLTIKPLVARLRPYEHETFRTFWLYVGAPMESEFSFPSGHATAAFAAMGALFFTTRKRFSWAALLVAALVAFTRLYFVVHYPTDVIFGTIIGLLAAVAAYFATRHLFAVLEKRQHPVPRFLLEADLASGARRLFSRKKQENK